MSRVDGLRSVAEWEGYFDSFKDHLAPVVFDAGPSRALTDEYPTVHPEQTAWARQMRRGIYMPVEGKVYVAVGYELCSPVMVVGDDGVLIIDPGENDERAAEVWADFQRFTDLPVRAILYTHRHPDHAFAAGGFGFTAEDVAQGRVDVIAHETFEQWMITDSSLIAPILTARSSQAIHADNEPAGKGQIHGGLGPTITGGRTSLYLPTITVGTSTDLTIAGIRLTAFHAYGDAQDEIDVWFPDLGHIHGSETIQGETFPNMYTLRGTAFRDPELWRAGVDHLLDHARQATSYSGSHMRPWVGNDFVVERITNYRDAIQFVYDQSIRHMNRGATGPELVDLVAKRLPDHLRDDPWLQPYYGTPEHSVRAVYDGTLGWFTGDVTELAAPLHADRAARYVHVMGGRDAVLGQAQMAIDTGEYGWAMELLTHVIRVDNSDMKARTLKADAMRQWGYQQKNMYWRTFAIGGAQELEGTVDYGHSLQFAPAGVVNALPAPKILEGLRTRLDPEKSATTDLTVGFHFTDSGERLALHVRRGVLVIETEPESPAATVTTTAATVHALISGTATLPTAHDNSDITIDGDQTALGSLFDLLDPPATDPILIVAR